MGSIGVLFPEEGIAPRNNVIFSRRLQDTPSLAEVVENAQNKLLHSIELYRAQRFDFIGQRQV